MDVTTSLLKLSVAGIILVVATLLIRIVYMQRFHPLSSFPGPWYAGSFSVVNAIISSRGKEIEWFMSLVKEYGTDRPIRVAPNLLMFPRPSALKDIYWDPKCNTKGTTYSSGALGPPQLFSTIQGEEHRVLRKALSNAPWTIGQLKNVWESRFDDQVNLFIEKMQEHATACRTICLSDKVAEFAVDIMSMVSFTNAFGSVQNQRDEKNILTNWRKGLPFFGFFTRCRFFRESVVTLPVVGSWLLPSISDDHGMGWLMCEAERQVTTRAKAIDEKLVGGQPDFLQHCLEARFSDGSPLTHMQRRAHVTLLIQAGADTTGTALGSILRFLITHPPALERVRAEITTAAKAGQLSVPIKYEETRMHLPFFVACIKEGLRLNPPAPNVFPRVMPKGGKLIDGHFVPAGCEAMSHAYTTQRYKDFYGKDAEEFQPDRWLASDRRTFELEAVQFTFGMGPRVCLGKDIAMMEMYKLLPEFVRHFDFELLDPGRYIVFGGVAYNEGFRGRLAERKLECL